MNAEPKNLQQAADERLTRYLEFNTDILGVNGPLDPRCQTCGGNAIDVSEQSRLDFVYRHKRLPDYLAPSVWLSHIHTFDNSRLTDFVLPNWVSEQTPYFMHRQARARTPIEETPLVKMAFVRPCSLCGEKDPFEWIRRHLTMDYVEQTPAPDLASLQRTIRDILDDERFAPKPKKPLTEDEIFALLKMDRSHLREAEKSKPPPDGNVTKVVCSKCGAEGLSTHRFCVTCGNKF